MAFGGTGFSFGSNNNNNQSPGFGGFGNSNTTGGFGNTTSNAGGFGSSTATSNPFGGSTFGSNTGAGFGSTTNNTSSTSLFGNKPATTPFGASTTNSGSLFGGASNTNTNTGGFGSSTGFGSTTNNAFGSNTNNAFSFGSNNKPAFGSTPAATTTPLFGQGGAGTTGGFGSSSGFGSTAATNTLGNQNTPPSDGTAVTPFAPHNEKDAGATTTSSYQSITFMQPYQKYSFEELRLADYNAGRQFGNGSGQAGAFGASTFGGFGASNTSGFGSNTNQPFGSTTTTSNAFGGNTATTGFGGGGLFGNANKPGGLFGQQSTATNTGGLFGTANNTTNPFGSTSTNTGFGASTGTSLFGNNQQNQTQNKTSLFGGSNTGTPGGFSFGNNTNTATNNNTTTTGGGIFGNTGTPNAFGNNNTQQPSGGLFGNTNNNQGKSLFGNTAGGFGTSTTQAQPSNSLFGSTNSNTTTGGLFGNTAPNTNTGGGLFGNTNNNTGGSLFGNNNNAAKPSLFGNNTLGGNTNTAPTGGGLFGNTANNNTQPSGGLFGNINNTGGSGFSFSGFNNNNQNKPGNSLFGNSASNQGGGLFGSSTTGGGLFNNSQQNQQSQQQDAVRHSSLLDPNPYGQSSIWTGLPSPTPDNSKPLITPLSATQKMKESQSKPPSSLRLNQARYMTPPRKGFGLSYSTYGTPSSAASTPGGAGLSGSMYSSRGFSGGSFGKSMGKSASVNNLRSFFAADGDSVLSPGAFAPSASRYSGGSIRRLTIDRNIRTDLFSRPAVPALTAPSQTANTNKSAGPSSQPVTNGEPLESQQKLKKRVSFDKDTTGGQTNGNLNSQTGALVRRPSDDDDDNTQESNAPESRPNNAKVASSSKSTDSEPVRGKELAMVPEDRESDAIAPMSRTQKDVQAKADPQPGDYWMKPSRAEMSKMPREKLRAFTNFEVGRQGCGRVIFNGTVDLTALPLDDLYHKIVEIRLRSVTVYPDSSSKPPVGKGLNVPSTIFIENSWPRSRNQPSSVTSGPIFDKHINRLKKMNGTEFISYDVSTGVWTFKVPHYTRYGLDYDDDEESMGQSMMSAPPDSIQQLKSAEDSGMDVDSGDYDESSEDDTFAFKHKIVPGGFNRPAPVDTPSDQFVSGSDREDGPESDHSAVSEDEEEDGKDVSMAGSFPGGSAATPASQFQNPRKSILRSNRPQGTPNKVLLELDGDWAEQLQRTISPRKQDRNVLRGIQGNLNLDRNYEPFNKRQIQQQDFRTSIDLMNSLFDRHDARMAGGNKEQNGGDFQIPSAKRAKPNDRNMTDKSSDLRQSTFKPLAQSMMSRKGDEINSTSQVKQEPMNIPQLLTGAKVKLTDGIPSITHSKKNFLSALSMKLSPAEVEIYELAHILFDEYDDEFTFGLPSSAKEKFTFRIKKDRLNKFWSSVLWKRHNDRIKEAEKNDPIVAALLHLSVRNVKEACDLLMRGKNVHLALLVAQIENSDDVFQQSMKSQIAAWKDQGMISEMTEEVRALYEILSGNMTVSQGIPNGPIEHQASTFSISKKYGLDWLQAFGLSLWYGEQKNKGIAEAVLDFDAKLRSKQESASPTGENGHDDTLWVLMKMFVEIEKGAKNMLQTLPQALGALARPEKIAQLFYSLTANLPQVYVDPQKADQLALDLASQCSSNQDLPGAIYAVLHLREAAKREASIKELLDQFAATLPRPESLSGKAQKQSPTEWSTLTTSLKVPASWIWTANAEHAKSINNSQTELECFVHAESWGPAHECFCHRVAPRLVIDEDYPQLRQALGLFSQDPSLKIGDWNRGGAIYQDFVGVVGKLVKSGNKRTDDDQKKYRLILERLATSLGEIEKKFVPLDGKSVRLGTLDSQELEERVAVKEMGRIVGELFEMDREHGGQQNQTLSFLRLLPSSQTSKLDHARSMAGGYYRDLLLMKS